MSRITRSDNMILADVFKNTTIENECFIFTGANNGKYPKVSYKGRSHFAHRVVYKIIKGEIFSGFDICHTCDNPCCINPTHLFMGTRKDNMQDCKKKGRNYVPLSGPGENAPNSKLKNRDVIDIFTSKKTRREMAVKYSVSMDCIKSIRCSKNWTHITSKIKTMENENA